MTHCTRTRACARSLLACRERALMATSGDRGGDRGDGDGDGGGGGGGGSNDGGSEQRRPPSRRRSSHFAQLVAVLRARQLAFVLSA